MKVPFRETDAPLVSDVNSDTPAQPNKEHVTPTNIIIIRLVLIMRPLQSSIILFSVGHPFLISQQIQNMGTAHHFCKLRISSLESHS